MKQLNLIFSLVFFLLIFYQTQAQHNHGSHDHDNKNMQAKEKPKTGVTDIILVYGNCGMCKNRIEGSLKVVEGVHSVEWDVETKVLTIKYNNEIISKDDIKKITAKAGHDTDKFVADSEVYNKFPICCQYEWLKN